MTIRPWGFLILAILVAVHVLMGCQPMPTKVTLEENQAKPENMQAQAKEYLSLGAVVLDIREPRDFDISRHAGSINVQPDHFVDSDRFRLARRLALWGIDPDVPVLVVGLAQDCGGKDSLCQRLENLGVLKVRYAHFRQIPMSLAREEFRPKPRPIWKPKEE